MDLFWLNGYEATSLHMLLEGMEISRQSSYDTFGTKHELFLKALHVYDRMILGHVTDLLSSGETPLEGIRLLIHFFVDKAATQPFRGCLVNNSAVEVGQRDEAAGEVVRRHWSKLEEMLKGALDQAVEAGELAPDTETRTLGRFLLGTIQGLLVLGKGKVEHGVAQDFARVALASLAGSVPELG